MKTNSMLFRLIPVIFVLTACAGGGETGTGLDTGPGNEKVHTGVITGFGSVFLNGVEFETTNATFKLDGGSGSESGLAVGMVITLRGSVNNDGVTGTASTVVYDDELEGIVLQDNIATGANSGTLNVMGRTVIVDANTLLKNVASADAIDVNNVVEVSGFASGGGDIYATRIERKSVTYSSGQELEVKGVVSDINTNTNTFKIGTLTVIYAQTSTLTDGWYVKVKSTQGLVNGELQASEVEKLANSGTRTVDADEGDEWEGEGIVTAALANGAFQLNGIVIKISGATQVENGTQSNLTTGTAVEVDGAVDASGNVVADKVEFRETADLEFVGNVEGVATNSSTLTLFGRNITVTTSTVMKDERDELQSFNLSHVAANTDRVRVRAYVSGASLIATQLERLDDPTTDPAEISGLVESSGGQFFVGGVLLNLTGCSSSCSVSPGDSIEASGTWAGSAFNVDTLEVD